VTGEANFRPPCLHCTESNSWSTVSRVWLTGTRWPLQRSRELTRHVAPSVRFPTYWRQAASTDSCWRCVVGSRSGLLPLSPSATAAAAASASSSTASRTGSRTARALSTTTSSIGGSSSGSGGVGSQSRRSLSRSGRHAFDLLSHGGEHLPPLLHGLTERVAELVTMGTSSGGGAAAHTASVRAALHTEVKGMIEALHGELKAQEASKAQVRVCGGV
jgi:hypothetical protein